jgi:hypothetical protein
MKSSVVVGDSCHVHSSLPLPASDQVQGSGYFEFEVETDMAALQLETSVTTLELEIDAAGLELETSMTSLELEMNTDALELETDTTALDLDIETDMPHELSKQERYSAD